MLASADQLLHVALYQWLIENKYIDKLLNIKSQFIEEFLKRGTVQHPETLAMFDLLWKYYEKNSEYVPAAKILAKLASIYPGPSCVSRVARAGQPTETQASSSTISRRRWRWPES